MNKYYEAHLQLLMQYTRIAVGITAIRDPALREELSRASDDFLRKIEAVFARLESELEVFDKQ